uniref:F-box domain-containing protein n=1 Tax=Ditylenchus dipsaci TaxID=166011 RepID=A0A915DUD2_9BILA
MVLPTETLLDVFAFLDYKTSAKLLIVSKRCNAILTPQMVLQAEKLMEIYNDLEKQLDELEQECEMWHSEIAMLQRNLSAVNESIFNFTVFLERAPVDEPERQEAINLLFIVKQFKEIYEQRCRLVKSDQTTRSQQLENLAHKMKDIEQTIPNKTKNLIEKNAKKIKRARKVLE